MIHEVRGDETRAEDYVVIIHLHAMASAEAGVTPDPREQQQPAPPEPKPQGAADAPAASMQPMQLIGLHGGQPVFLCSLQPEPAPQPDGPTGYGGLPLGQMLTMPNGSLCRVEREGLVQYVPHSYVSAAAKEGVAGAAGTGTQPQ